MYRFGRPQRARIAVSWIATLFTLALLGCVASVVSAGERLLLEQRSPFNTIFVTEDDAGLRVMRFERHGARQTVVRVGDPDHLELAYAKAIPVALALVERPRRVLVIGLGGGTLPMFLHKRLPEVAIDAVELDPGVVDVAKSHFGFREDAKLRAFVDDGRRFIERTAERYDIIILDAFGPDSIPYPLVTREFHQAVRRVLTPSGVVVANIWARHSNPLYESMLRTYETAYESAALIEIERSGNRLVAAGPWRPFPSKSELLERCVRLTRTLPLRDDLARIVDRGWRPIPGEAADGRVLLDADAPK